MHTVQEHVNIMGINCLIKRITKYEELVSKTSYIHSDMLLIFIIDFILQSKKIKIYVIMFVVWVTFIWHIQQYVQSD